MLVSEAGPQGIPELQHATNAVARTILHEIAKPRL